MKLREFSDALAEMIRVADKPKEGNPIGDTHLHPDVDSAKVVISFDVVVSTPSMFSNGVAIVFSTKVNE